MPLLEEEELLNAARQGDLQRVKKLVEKGVDLNAKDKIDYTPLHLAAIGGHLDVVRFLVEKGANVNIRDEDGRTPLHFAAYYGHLDVVRFLVEKGANVNARGFIPDQTPLHYAAVAGHLDVVRFLLEAGADPSVRDGWGKTPADLAREKGYSSVAELIENWVQKRGKRTVPRL